MAVRYVRVKPVVETFTPVVRATGNLAVVGAASTGTNDVPVPVPSPSAAETLFGPPGGSALTRALQIALVQSPGPAQVWGVRSGADPGTALAAVENLDVQFVVLAGTPLKTENAEVIGKLVTHVLSVSDNGGEGRERMGVAMLDKGATSPAVVTGTLAQERMVYVAHKSDQDAAAAVAGTIAGYEPHVSMLLKKVSIDSAPFSAADLDTLNGPENFPDPPNGNGVNWLLARPALLSGSGTYLGEGYTGNKNGKKFIDVVRTVDDISFKLKARLIRSVGALRISRSGLRALSVQMEAVLVPLVTDGVIESFDITIPVLELLDADPDALTDVQLQAIRDAQDQRLVQVLVAVDYAGAVHRIAITLKFT